MAETISKWREWTLLCYAAMDEGRLEPRAVADMALMYMSEHDVKDMLQSNDIDLKPDEDEEDDEDEESPFDKIDKLL